jgi:hypothetical protein
MSRSPLATSAASTGHVGSPVRERMPMGRVARRRRPRPQDDSTGKTRQTENKNLRIHLTSKNPSAKSATKRILGKEIWDATFAGNENCSRISRFCRNPVSSEPFSFQCLSFTPSQLFSCKPIQAAHCQSH